MVDTDEMIESRVGKRIAVIFQEEGEVAFRQYERDAVNELRELRRTVISTGGGLVVDPANLESLRTHALVVCLWASADAIWERVRHQSHRPLLSAPNPYERIRELLTQREPFYRQADVLVSTDGRSVREVAMQVAHQYRVAVS